MTNFKEMTFDEIQNYIEQLNQVYYRGEMKDLLIRVKELTAFLDFHPRVPNVVRTFCIRNGIDCIEKHPICQNPDCNNPVSIKSGNHGFSKACSKSCMVLVRAKTHETNFLEHHGVKNPMNLKENKEKRDNTNIQRYGSKSPMQNKEVQEKRENTLYERSGFFSTFENPEVREKSEKTNKEIFGGENPMKNGSIKEKKKESWSLTWEREKEFIIEKRNMTMKTNRSGLNVLDDREFLSKLYFDFEMNYEEIGKMLNVNKQTVCNRMKQYGLSARSTFATSSAEKEIREFIQSLGFDTVQNDRTILDGKEIDIFIPELNLGIEYNGIHWHSTKYNTYNHYHLNKTRLAESKGIRLIHIFEDEWIEKKDIVLDKIANLCGIRKTVVYARKTECHEITNNTAKTFYNSNHIQGYATATKVYGLYHNLQLVACMSFKASRTNVEGEWDLSRFATSCNVVGGFSKLLKRFIRDNNPSSIISFADKRWSQGDLYLKNGFIHEYDTKPNYYYVENKSRVRKENYRRNKLPKKLGDCFDPNLSEFENTERAGIYRIYDCGLMKFRMDL